MPNQALAVVVMQTSLIQIVVPVSLMFALAVPFMLMAKDAFRADSMRQRRAQRLSKSARDTVVGSVGWGEPDALAAHFDCGMVSREENGRIVIARQARLTQDTLASL